MKMSRQQEMIDRLKLEADALREPFSPLLHARTMREVRESKASTHRPALLPWRWLAVGTVALTAIAVVPLWHQPAPAVPVSAKTPEFSQVGNWLAIATDPMRQSIDESVKENRMASLDHDAQSFGRFIVSQLDVIPQPPQGNRPTPN